MVKDKYLNVWLNCICPVIISSINTAHPLESSPPSLDINSIAAGIKDAMRVFLKDN